MEDILNTQLDDSKEYTTVAIVGRPNVGKSTFFNRIIGKRKSLVFNRPGVTKDRHYGEAIYENRKFVFIDTGGLEKHLEEDNVFYQIEKQVSYAIDEADLVLVFFDGREGLLPGDSDVVGYIRKTNKPAIYVVNKIDTIVAEQNLYDFYRLGITSLFPISSEHIQGFDELIDEILLKTKSKAIIKYDDEKIENKSSILDTKDLTEENEYKPNDRPIKVTIIGRPNVGKSSIINRILQDERQVTHEQAGTTTDSVDIPFSWEGTDFILVDTAGFRKRNKVSDRVEQLSNIKATQAVSLSDVVLLVIDAEEGVALQEQRLAMMAAEEGASIVVVVNKWDKYLRLENHLSTKAFEEELFQSLTHIRYAQVCFVSAINGFGINTIFQSISRAYRSRVTNLKTTDLNKNLQQWLKNHTPPLYKKKAIKIYYISQIKTKPPTFIVFVNIPEGVATDYKRYLEQQMRKSYDLVGTPIRFIWKLKS